MLLDKKLRPREKRKGVIAEAEKTKTFLKKGIKIKHE